jgi:outer membrane lipoprotein-sorting protein
MFAAASIQWVQAAVIDEISDPMEKGLAIARRSYETDSGFDDFFAELTIVQGDTKGKEELRHIRLWGLENAQDGDRSISVFVYPPDVKGMARLSHVHKDRPDDHWVYDPENKRVRRVSPTSQLSYFMGTQFTFEDLRLYRAESLDKYSFEYIGEGSFDGMACYRVRRLPVRKKFTNYAAQVMWIDKEEFRVVKVEFYNRKDVLVKTLTRSHFKLYKGKFWAMQQMEMTNNLTGEHTLVIWSNYQFGLGLDESDFSRESLKRLK